METLKQKIIFSSYYCKYFLDDCLNNRNSKDFSIFKCNEVAVLWYYYIRKFSKNNHIFIFDQNSPVKISHFLKFINEEIDFVKDLNCIDFNKKFHVFSFEEIINSHSLGAFRFTNLSYKIAHFYNSDFYHIEQDCLINFDIIKETETFDFATGQINLKDFCCDTFLLFISSDRLKSLDFLLPFPKFLDRLNFFYKNYVTVGKSIEKLLLAHIIERSIYCKFCYGKVKSFNGILPYIHFHMGGINELYDFFQKNPIEENTFFTETINKISHYV